ncbi:NTP pyrophosphohydrolase [Streptomyces fenghuangensis]|uniref:NTP pyrophosphohydrolase n=1 Tax=Streptomyces chitinivorans TaxID=1257027 RepID=A0ABW7HWW2_9ACTN|nr:NTP pyrophosphohydrolase [Streptomyces chitinivorans]MDH2411472.1 NTP pyrophosphohydrolase [Streptomyces chitinivorans]
MPGRLRPLLVVDAANVVGSVPDGWWRDRRGAAERLRDRLAARAAGGGGEGTGDGEDGEEIVLVVEGAARGVASVPGVRVVEAPGSGDDRIVELVAAEGRGRPCTVVTADRGLRERVAALGAGTAGPRSVR